MLARAHPVRARRTPRRGDYRYRQADDFGPEFVALARSRSQEDDRRAEIRRRIDERLGSAVVEENSDVASGPACA